MKTYDVDPGKLTQVFDTTTSTYKFYWLLALMDQIKLGKAYHTISFTEMVASMVGKAWNPITSGLFTFGKCDALIQRVRLLIFKSELRVYDVEERVRKYIAENADEPAVMDLVDKMTKYVPYRFLYPWIGSGSNSDSAACSRDFATYRCPYEISKKSIRINPAWVEYLTDHRVMIEAFAKMQLQLFLLDRKNNILFADNDFVATTADGSSTSIAIQAGMVAESTPSYSVAKCDELEKKLKQMEKELIQARQTIYKMASAIGPMTLNNYGTLAGSVDKIQSIIVPQN